ncbi:MAG: hypothetical protein IBX61_04955 [Thermoleophilia bacterium]|nr:hypothetical protein [Thermoleophilia bacterium]
MDPVIQISNEARMRLRSLGDEIIRFADEKKSILKSTLMSEAEKQGKIDSEKTSLRMYMDIVFGEGDGSIAEDIRRILAESGDSERAKAAAGVWHGEIPGLRRFVEYCAQMIEEDPGSPEARKGGKCLIEATEILNQIADRAERAAREQR